MHIADSHLIGFIFRNYKYEKQEISYKCQAVYKVHCCGKQFSKVIVQNDIVL